MKKSLFVIFAFFAGPLFADAPIVQDVAVSQSGGTWGFSVTISHPDSGWDHYADGWEVLNADGNRLGLRVLAHPHVNEQPFTRSLSGVVVPDGSNSVFIRSRCIVDGWSTETFEVSLEN